MPTVASPFSSNVHTGAKMPPGRTGNHPKKKKNKNNHPQNASGKQYVANLH